jgi:phosphatidylinositol glycan class V
MGSLFEIRQLYALSGVVISNASFVLASIGLIALTNRIFKRKELTFWTGVLFAINPASVFMSAVYTESTYTMLAIWGMYFYTLSADYFGNTRTPALFGLLSAALFALATATRGNGIILCGFFAYHFMRSFRQGSILPRVSKSLCTNNSSC